MELDYETIGSRIRELRRKNNWSQEYLAEMVNLSDKYIGNIERAEREVSLPAIVSIAAALGVTVNDLLGENQPDHTYSEDINQLLLLCSPNQRRYLYKLITVAYQLLFEENIRF